MTAYIGKVLEPGEAISYRAKLTPISYLPSVGVIVVGIVIAVAGAQFIAIQILGGIIIAIGIVLAIWMWIKRATTEIAVTNRRVILKTGLISRRTVEMILTRIESVDVRQSILGRVLNYGDVLIRGTGSGMEPIKGIDAPIEFRRKVLSAP